MGDVMVDKIMCTACHKLNEVHKFCVFCGHKLLDDEQIELILDNPDPYCLNCGRSVKKNQTNCECGYEFGDINCPDCNAKNSYANRFCTSCGKKLWTSDVYYYKYPKRLFENHLLNEVLPVALRNTSLNKRLKKGIGKNPLSYGGGANTIPNLQSEDLKIDKYLSEICSRWKIVSPNYCINCLGIIKPDECSCTKCGSRFSADKLRIESIQTKEKYIKPSFHDVELKWAPKYSEDYLNSLAPAIGESQFEYRERLKWEFAENNNLKIIIRNAIDTIKRENERKKQQEEYKKQQEERRKREKEYIRQYGGGYCDIGCQYFYEEFLDSRGGIVGDFDSEGYVEYYCSLGHTVSFGSFCKDYK